MRTIVERARQSDIPRLVELMSQFYAESNHPLDRAWAEKSFRQLLTSNERGGAWLARRETEVVGYVVLTLRHSMEFGRLAGFIDDLFVRPHARRSGVGSALLTAVFGACRGLGAAAVQVEAGSNNVAAEALYRAFGLLPYTDGRHTLTARLMKEKHAV